MRQIPRGMAMAGAAIVGGATVVQSRINSGLGIALDDGLLAAWISFSVGLIVIVAIVAFSPKSKDGIAKLRGALNRGEIKSWMLLGGLGGACFVAAQGLTVESLGIAVFTIAAVASQNATSLAVDNYGLGPAGKSPVTPLRLLAAISATVGVAIGVSTRIDAPAFTWAALIFTIAASAPIALQQAVNGRVSKSSGSPIVAGLMNFTVGWIGLTLAVGISHAISGRGFSAPPAPWSQPVLWTGGLIGLCFIVVSASVIHSLGVLLFMLASIAGQMVSALAIDAFFPTSPHPLSWTLVAAVALTGAAVMLAALTREKGHGAGK